MVGTISEDRFMTVYPVDTETGEILDHVFAAQYFGCLPSDLSERATIATF